MSVQGKYLVPKAELRKLSKEGAKGFDSEVVVFRTALMNVFTLEPGLGDQSDIDRFLKSLLPLLRAARTAIEAPVITQQ